MSNSNGGPNWQHSVEAGGHTYICENGIDFCSCLFCSYSWLFLFKVVVLGHVVCKPHMLVNNEGWPWYCSIKSWDHTFFVHQPDHNKGLERERWYGGTCVICLGPLLHTDCHWLMGLLCLAGPFNSRDVISSEEEDEEKARLLEALGFQNNSHGRLWFLKLRCNPYLYKDIFL